MSCPAWAPKPDTVAALESRRIACFAPYLLLSTGAIASPRFHSKQETDPFASNAQLALQPTGRLAPRTMGKSYPEWST